MEGTISMLFKVKLDEVVAKVDEPRDVTGICAPLPTIFEGAAGERERSIPSELCMCVEAPLSIAH